MDGRKREICENRNREHLGQAGKGKNTKIIKSMNQIEPLFLDPKQILKEKHIDSIIRGKLLESLRCKKSFAKSSQKFEARQSAEAADFPLWIILTAAAVPMRHETTRTRQQISKKFNKFVNKFYLNRAT